MNDSIGSSRLSAPMFASRARAGTEHQIAPATPLTPQGIMSIVQRIAARAGLLNPALSTLRPHDLRRSYAGMAKDGGADLDMIKHALGHSSVVTTERYVNSIQNLKIGFTASDHIRIKKKSVSVSTSVKGNADCS